MATIIVCSDSLERMQGFLAGIEWVNDSALSLRSLDPQRLTAVFHDQDAEQDRTWRLGPFGLEPEAD